MKIIFETKNLNKNLYANFINKSLLATLGFPKASLYFKQSKSYQVILRPSSMASEDKFFHGKDGVGGVTDPEKCILYMLDTDDNPKNARKPNFETNANVISHELLGHRLLYWAGKNQKVALRHDDFSGHKAGAMLNFSTAEVHDRDTENFSWYFDFDVWYWKYLKTFTFRVKILDFRDLLD